MGYESRVYVGLRLATYHGNDSPLRDYATKLATFYLSKMGYEFPGIFKTPIDFDMYIDDTDVEICEDCYGKVCKYADIDTVFTYLENEIAKGNNYRRLLMFYAFVKNLKDNISMWADSPQDIVFVHYGY